MNDERPIEKLLRRYAKKRGDEAGPPPELHSATRRLLQGEVARQFPKPEVERKPAATGFFALLTRRWVYAVGLFVVLGVTAVMFLPALSKSKDRALLVQKSSSEDLAVRESVLPAAAPAIAPAMPPVEAQPTLAVATDRRDLPAPEPSGGGNLFRVRDESAAASYLATNGLVASSRFAVAKQDSDSLRKREETKTVSLGTALDSAASKPGTVTVVPPARAAGETASAGRLALNRASQPAPPASARPTDGLVEARQTLAGGAAPVASAVRSTGSQDKAYFARGGGVEKDAERLYSQSFANIAPDQLRAKAAKVKAENPVTPVLASFQIQQNGNELRVIDSDGSTYVGAANVAADSFGVGGAAGKELAAATFENSARRQTPAPASAVMANQQQMQNYQWRAEGTNRTLNQNVVFTWNFIETNALAGVNLNYDAAGQKLDAAKLPSQFPAQLQNSLINGRAQFGPGQEIEVNAVPVRP